MTSCGLERASRRGVPDRLTGAARRLLPAAVTRRARDAARSATAGPNRPAPRRFWWAPSALYTAGLLVAAVLAETVAPATWRGWLDYASTDLDNLGRHPAGSLLLSAFLTESNPVVWIGLSLVGLAGPARRLGPIRTAALVLTAHLVGTLVSQGLLVWRLQAGLAEQTDRFELDVGPSYVIVAGLVAGVLVGRSWWRPLCAVGVGVLLPYLFDGLIDGQVAAVGHVVAIVVGLVGAALLTLRTPTQA